MKRRKLQNEYYSELKHSDVITKVVRANAGYNYKLGNSDKKSVREQMFAGTINRVMMMEALS